MQSLQVVIRIVDTDVLVLAVAFAGQLPNNQTTEVWLSLGTGNRMRYVAAHEIARALGSQMSKALPFFHAFTGCDTVSSFAGKGKKTALATWKTYPDVTESFLEMLDSPTSLQPESECFRRLERFVILLYERTSTKTSVNEERKHLFTQGKAFDAIPPTQAALFQHAKRALFQSAYCWSQALTPAPVLPTPDMWGWVQKEGQWHPFWTQLPDITASCRELVRCKCKKGCQGRCSCVKADLKCTALCSCNENCNN